MLPDILIRGYGGDALPADILGISKYRIVLIGEVVALFVRIRW